MGLENLTSIGCNSLHFWDDRTRDLFSWFGELTSVGGYIHILGNYALINLSGINSLNYVGGSLIIYGNTNLESLTGSGKFDFISAYI